MTETQNIRHDAPLKPGEIRTHTVGDVDFAVMHAANGSFTQATVRDENGGRVLATEVFEDRAIRAYADAIEQAESDARATRPYDVASGSYVTDEPLGEMLPTPEPGSLSELVDAYGEAMARGGIELASGRTVQHGIAAAVEHTTRADALKAEILARFGGER